MKDVIAVIDFGSQYSQLICRRIRESGVYAELFQYDIKESDLENFNLKGIILSGGPNSVYEKKSPQLPKFILKKNIPIFGICYGMQLLIQNCGGKVIQSKLREYGVANLNVENNSSIFFGLKKKEIVWMSHGDEVVSIPNECKKIASTENCKFAAIENLPQNIFGIQFHPEVKHTKSGKKILENFIFKICKCKKSWTPKSFINETIHEIRNKIGNEKIILGLSGGVDSSVTAALLHKAIGNNLICIFVDNGLLRKNEFENVNQTFKKFPHFNLISVNAKKKFLSALKNVINPETKRKIIGKTFIEVFESTIQKQLKNSTINFFAQGTLYPDVIESAHPERKKAGLIKTHHNVGGLPKNLKFTLIEPLRYLFKDEVRKVGKSLGLPDEIIFRHPFPGPGLAVRIIGNVNEKSLSILREADFIFNEELLKANLYKKLWQSFAVLTNVKSVGVMGDGRTYENLLALRAVQSDDGMTADWSQLPFSLLKKVSSRIVNEVKGINRIVYDISSKPPSTIEWE